jgi:hypothetical protein
MAGTKRVQNVSGAYGLGIDPLVEIEEFLPGGVINAGDAVALSFAGAANAAYGLATITQDQVIQAVAATPAALVVGIALDSAAAASLSQTIRVATRGYAIAHASAAAIGANVPVAAGNNAATTGNGTISTCTAVTSELVIGVSVLAMNNNYAYIWVEKA